MAWYGHPFGCALRGCMRSGTGILPVRFRGIGVPPMRRGRDAHATKERLLTHPLRGGSAHGSSARCRCHKARPSQIGFVSHDWLCLYGTARPSSLWPCRTRPCREIGFVLYVRPAGFPLSLQPRPGWRIGFVLRKRPARAGGRGPQAGHPAATLYPIRNPKSEICNRRIGSVFRSGALRRCRTIGPWPSLTSHIKLHTSDFSLSHVPPYYAPCCRNRVKKMSRDTSQNRRKSLF